MESIVMAVVVVFLLIMGFKAYQGYGGYRGSLYQQLFSSYPEYFWRLTFKEDLSVSSYLSDRLGAHRITYNAYFDGQGRQVATFATVFSTRGHATICMVPTAGTISGKDTGTWFAECDGRRLAIPSPITYIKRQKRFFDSFMKGAPVEYIIASGPSTDMQGVHCSYTVLSMSAVVDHLAAKPEGAVSEQDMLAAFESFKEIAQHAK